MNFNVYKETFENIKVDTNKIKRRFSKTIYEIQDKEGIKKPYFKLFYNNRLLLGSVTVMLILSILLVNLSIGKNVSDFSIKVYAADKNDELLLSNQAVSVLLSNAFKMGGFSNDDIGNINFDLNFICEGDNIKSITYQLSDHEITIFNKQEEVAWFVENASYNLKSKDNYRDELLDESIYESFWDDDMRYVTKMIGSKYLVEFTNQNNKQYGLVINLFKDDKGKFSAKNFMITVTATMDDGTIVEKYISVEPYIGDLLNFKTSEDMPRLNMTIKSEK